MSFTHSPYTLLTLKHHQKMVPMQIALDAVRNNMLRPDQLKVRKEGNVYSVVNERELCICTTLFKIYQDSYNSKLRSWMEPLAGVVEPLLHTIEDRLRIDTVPMLSLWHWLVAKGHMSNNQIAVDINYQLAWPEMSAQIKQSRDARARALWQHQQVQLARFDWVMDLKAEINGDPAPRPLSIYPHPQRPVADDNIERFA